MHVSELIRWSTTLLQAETLFEEDYTINQEYHTILDGKWDQ